MDELPTPPPPAALEPSLEDVRSAKLYEINLDTQADIYSGFHSNALGADYLYPANEDPPHHDQQNLNASVVASILHAGEADWTTPFWCADADGVWAMRPHTATQIQQVGEDGKARILACMVQNDALTQQVNNATTIEAIQGIVWQSPT